jgi:hypothetical protein
MSEQQPGRLKHRLKFIGLILVFLSPFIAGWMALYVFKVRPDSNQYGTLVQPVKSLSFPALSAQDGNALDAGFWNKWTFVVIANDGCQQQCQQNMYYLRQMRIALGRDIDRMQNVLVVTGKLSDEMQAKLAEYPALTVVSEAPSALVHLFDLPGIDTGSSPMLYLVDPAGNLMMTYTADNKPKSVLSDLQRLLKNSQIG